MATIFDIALLVLGIAILALPTVIAGFGLLARKSWARPLTIILAIFNLFAFPIGTALAQQHLRQILGAEAIK